MRKLLVPAAVLALVIAPWPVHAALQPVAPGWSAVRIADGLYQPLQGIAVDAVTHDAFVVDFNPPASGLYRITTAGTRTLLASGHFDAGILVFDPATRVLYLSESGALVRFDESGAPLGSTTGQVSALALGADGALYGGAPGRIMRRDPGTGAWLDWRTFDASFASLAPSTLTFDASGSAFVMLLGYVCRVDPGATVRLGGLPLALGLARTSSQLLCGPLAFDPLGTDTPAGTGLAWVVSDNATGMVRGVATDPDGRIYVTASGPAPGAGSVWMVSPAGTVPARPSTWGAIKSLYR